MSDIVRVLRVIEYVGTREFIDSCLKNSIQGTKVIPGQGEIHSAVLGATHEILAKQRPPVMTEKMIQEIKDLYAEHVGRIRTYYPISPWKKMIHKDCGGAVVEELKLEPYRYESQNGVEEIHYPFICQECGEEILGDPQLEDNEDLTGS